LPETISLAIGGAVAAPIVAGALIRFTPERFAELWTYLAAAIALACVLIIAPDVSAGATPALIVVEFLPKLELAFRVDSLGLTFAGLASSLWVVTSIYSSGYVRATDLSHRRRYFACFAASIGAANAIAFSSNVLTMIIGFEMLTVVTYPLVAHDESEKALAAGRRYLAYALSGGLALTVAAVWTWQIAGTLDFRAGGFLGVGISSAWALFFLYFAGAGVKAAIMPLHDWLPTAMVAPTPVSALLHAVAVVKAGVFGCIRFLGFVFEPELLRSFSGDRALFTFCAITIVTASLIALREDQLKRRLAYSTIASLSTIVLGASLLSPHGLAGALLYFVNHAAGKITLFFCAGSLYANAHKDRISELGGIGRKMPWTMGAFSVAALSLVGLPGLGIFIAKLTLLRGAVEAADLIALAVLSISSLLSAAYLYPIVRTAFFDKKDSSQEAGVHEAGLLMRVPLLMTATATVLLGMIPAVIDTELRLASMFAASVLGVGP
jgi:multicomponent Na+:H+ antiporter subunit D